MRRIGTEAPSKPGVIVIQSVARKLTAVPTSNPRIESQSAKWDTTGMLPTLARMGKVIHGLNG